MKNTYTLVAVIGFALSLNAESVLETRDSSSPTRLGKSNVAETEMAIAKAIQIRAEEFQKAVGISFATNWEPNVDIEWSLSNHPGQQVSIINFTAHGLHGKGLVYPLSDFTNWWQGTLNECTSTEFTIEAEGEYLVFVTTSSLPPLQQSTR